MSVGTRLQDPASKSREQNVGGVSVVFSHPTTILYKGLKEVNEGPKLYEKRLHMALLWYKSMTQISSAALTGISS